MAIGVPQGSLAGCCGGEAVLAGDCHGSVVCDLGGTGLGGGRGAPQGSLFVGCVCVGTGAPQGSVCPLVESKVSTPPAGV